MNKRPISKSTQIKILQTAAEILRMHADVAGNRCCQDWSGDEDKNPALVFDKNERDDLQYNYQIENSDLEDYEPFLDFFHDEVSVSFTLADALDDMVDELE